MANNSSPISSPATAPITAVACLWCVVVFLAMNLTEGGISWQDAAAWGYFPDSVVWEGKPWILISSSFVHIEIWHIAFNLYWLWVLGSCFEETVGWIQWVIFLLASAWVSAALELLLGGNSGIGMSGVGYALFGFGWVSRRKLSRFAEILDERTVQIFVIWLFLCIVLTNFGIMQIANWAHIFGLAFGAGIGGVYVLREQRWLPAAGVALLVAVSFVPLKWCPTSPDWNAKNAEQAHDRKDFAGAIPWYQRALARGADPSWAWSNLAIIYGYQENQVEYSKAMNELRKIDEKVAREIEADYGAPVKAGK